MVDYKCVIIKYPSIYGWVIEHGLCITNYGVYLIKTFLKCLSIIDYISISIFLLFPFLQNFMTTQWYKGIGDLLKTREKSENLSKIVSYPYFTLFYNFHTPHIYFCVPREKLLHITFCHQCYYSNIIVNPKDTSFPKLIKYKDCKLNLWLNS